MIFVVFLLAMIFAPLIFAICMVLGLLCWFLALRMRLNIPFVELKFPYIFGNNSSEQHLALQFQDFYRRYRNHPIIGLYMLCLKPSVMIIDPELIKRVLSTNFKRNFQNRGMYFNLKDPLSAILGTLEHDQWRPLRHKLTPAFTPNKIKDMFPVMKLVGDELVRGVMEMIATDTQIEIRDLFSRFTIDVIGKVAIGIDCNTLNGDNQLREMAKMAMQPYLKFPWNILTITFPKVARFLGIRKHHKEVSDTFVDIFNQNIQYRKVHSEKSQQRTDYMQLLIDLKLTTNEITALAFDLLSAGYADITSTLCYCLYELSLPENKRIQNKARLEILSTLEENNGQLTYDVLHKMVYCDQIIQGNFI